MEKDDKNFVVFHIDRRRWISEKPCRKEYTIVIFFNQSDQLMKLQKERSVSDESDRMTMDSTVS